MNVCRSCECIVMIVLWLIAKYNGNKCVDDEQWVGAGYDDAAHSKDLQY